MTVIQRRQIHDCDGEGVKYMSAIGEKSHIFPQLPS